jgi:hypothetical protein
MKRSEASEEKENMIIIRKLTEEEELNPPWKNKATREKYSLENYLSHFKPASDTKVLTIDGHEITSEPVIALIKEAKQLIEKGNADDFWNLIMCTNDKNSSFTNQETESMFRTIITDNGLMIFDLISEIDDLRD